MTVIRAYHRPRTLEEALDLLQDPNCAPLGGGTVLGGLPRHVPDSVVDLQALGLGEISEDGATTVIGSTATLQRVASSASVPPLLQDLAVREAPNTIRNAATIGGTVAAAETESGLLAGLLAHEATVQIAASGGPSTVLLDDVLTGRESLDGALITAVRVTRGDTGAWEATGRTPADTPIVLVAGVRTEDQLRLAATGVGPTPRIIDLDAVDTLEPPNDFRGSAAYRRHLADVLGARVVARLSEPVT